MTILRLFATACTGAVLGTLFGWLIGMVYISGSWIDVVEGPRYAEFDIFGVFLVALVACLLASIASPVLRLLSKPWPFMTRWTFMLAVTFLPALVFLFVGLQWEVIYIYLTLAWLAACIATYVAHAIHRQSCGQ